MRIQNCTISIQLKFDRICIIQLTMKKTFQIIFFLFLVNFEEYVSGRWKVPGNKIKEIRSIRE